MPVFSSLLNTVQLITYPYTHQTLRRAKYFSHSSSCENSTVCDSPIEIQPGRTSFSGSCLVVSCQSSRIASATFHAFHCITSLSPSRHSPVEGSKERQAQPLSRISPKPPQGGINMRVPSISDSLRIGIRMLTYASLSTAIYRFPALAQPCRAQTRPMW